MALINDFESRFLLGIPAMDRAHREFVDLVNRMDRATDASFAYLFSDLIHHTRAHFATEEVLMRATGFPGSQPHRAEHARVLTEMEGLAEHLGRGRLASARRYVQERLPGWFADHAQEMDNPLAEHLRSSTRMTSAA
jgi:hemerythrin-like metal-binding protein